MLRTFPGPATLAVAAVLAGGVSQLPAPAVGATVAPAVSQVASSTPAAQSNNTESSTPAGKSKGTSSGSPCAAAAKACVDLSKQQAWLTDGAGHVTYGPVPARGGAKGAKTPKGTFSVIWKDQNHLSKEFNNAPMPYSVFFYPGDAFHGGNPNTASNGCVHLNIGAAQKFFSTLNYGDKVEVR